MKIKINSTGQICLVETEPKYEPGKELLVDADGIIESAIVLCAKDCPKSEPGVNDANIKILREFSPEDKLMKQELLNEGKKYLLEAQKKVFRHGLEMKVLRAELSFDRKKLTFYFTADGRVDFRSLVSDMIGDFGKIIRLQQISSREESKIYGGFGKCGRELCCTKFLNNLENVSLEMAEIQEINNPKSNMFAGCCGKLMCCLSYEADSYQELKKSLPKTGTYLKTKEGEGKVVSVNVLLGKAVVETKDGKKIEVTV